MVVLLFNRDKSQVVAYRGEAEKDERMARQTAARVSLLPVNELTMFAEVVDLKAKQREVYFYFVADLAVLEDGMTTDGCGWMTRLAMTWKDSKLDMVTALRGRPEKP